jgi:tetratricopeptide (TPR) repeat protein
MMMNLGDRTAFSVLLAMVAFMVLALGGEAAEREDLGTTTTLNRVDLEAAAEKIREGRLEEAGRRLEGLLQSNPGDLRALVLKARVLELSGDWDALEPLAWRLCDDPAGTPWGYLFLGRMNILERKWRSALGFFRQGAALAKRPDAAAIDCVLGSFDALFLLREHDEALKTLGRFSWPRPGDPDLVERVLLAQLAGSVESGDMTPLLLHLAAGKPSAHTVWLWGAFLERTVRDLVAQGRLSQAMSVAREFCRWRPDSSAAWNSLAVAEWSRGRHEAGFRAFRRAESLPFPGFAMASRYVVAGGVAASIEAADLQIEFYTKAAAADGGTALVLNNLAWGYYLKNEKTNLALELAKQAVRMAPEAAYLDTLARLQARAGKVDEARKNMNRAIELSLFDPYVEDMKAFRRKLGKVE